MNTHSSKSYCQVSVCDIRERVLSRLPLVNSNLWSQLLRPKPGQRPQSAPCSREAEEQDWPAAGAAAAPGTHKLCAVGGMGQELPENGSVAFGQQKSITCSSFTVLLLSNQSSLV